jgi:hypothetical protein
MSSSPLESQGFQVLQNKTSKWRIRSEPEAGRAAGGGAPGPGARAAGPGRGVRAPARTSEGGSREGTSEDRAPTRRRETRVARTKFAIRGYVSVRAPVCVVDTNRYVSRIIIVKLSRAAAHAVQGAQRHSAARGAAVGALAAGRGPSASLLGLG